MFTSTAPFTHRAAAAAWTQTGAPKDATQAHKVDELQTFYQRPSNGRSTRLGRRVEKPGDARAAGPSGQHEATMHDAQHTNK